MSDKLPVDASTAGASVPVDGQRSLTRNGFALALNSGISAALGGLFWLLAARLYPEDQVGRDSALISAMLLLAAIASLNAGTVLPRFLPQLAKRSRKVVIQSYAATTAFSIVLSVAFVFIVPNFADSLEFLHGSAGVGLLLILGVVTWNIFGLQDSVLTAVRRAYLVLVENTVFGVLKLALMVGFALLAIEYGIFYAWLVPTILLLIPINWILFNVALRKHEHHPEVASSMLGQEGSRSKITRFLAFDYLGTVFMQTSVTMLPLLVISALGATQNGYFFIAFTVVTVVGQMGEAIGQQLTVEGAFDERALGRLTRHTMRRFGLLLLPCVAFVIAAAPLLLWLFGPSYSENATTLLRILAIAVIPGFVLSVFQAVERVRGNAGRILASQALRCVLAITTVTVAMGDYGLNGVGWAWLLTQTIVALAVAAPLIGVMRKG